MFKHILTAADGTELSLRAVEMAARLAIGFGARLTIVAASELRMTVVAAEGYIQPNDYSRMRDVSLRQEREHLDEAGALARKLGMPDTMVKTVQCEETDPAHAIIHKAGASGCDLVVIGSRGRRGLTKLLLGSQTAEVLAGTQIPVLVVR